MRRLLPVLLLLGASAGARAEGDGGARSPLAIGAGNRALALGGAYTALAADPSAIVWNPAGLGRLAQASLQASRASLYGLETTEEYVAVAWPSWRWGAVGMTGRRLGTDDIERRDERNLLLGDFSASDVEIGLAWGRALGDAWCVGAGAKLARQQIDGRSDNGLGADVGVLVRPGIALGSENAWLDRMTLGLAVRNLVPPSIRLDEATVTEPTEFHAGAECTQAFGPGRAVTLSLDASAAQRTDPSLRGGMELRVHPLLALRGGWNGDSFTAGAGVQWRGTSFDYAFEDNPIATVHRFGLTLGFGATVAERRDAARLAEETEFSRRLDELFASREAARLAELLDRGEALLREGRRDEAADAAASARALRPDDRRARVLEASCLVAQAAEREAQGELADALILYGRALVLVPDDLAVAESTRRCREASDLRQERSARIRSLYRESLDAFTGGEYVAAREKLHTMLSLAPDDVDGQTLLVRTEAALASRVAELVQQARAATADGRFRDAEDRLAAARSVDPSGAGITTAAEQLRRAAREAELRTARAASADSGKVVAIAPAVAPPAPSRKKQRELADLYGRGVEAAEGGRSDDAVRYWELVWSADPGYEQTAEFLKREYLLRGLDAFSRGALDDAIRTWEKARAVDPADERTLGYLARAREQQGRSRQILGEPR